MNSKNNLKICIIGAGISGLAAGALLLKKGYDISIYEKESLIGGRALSLDGSSLDFDNYNNLLSRFKMKIAYSEPDLKTIFKDGMLRDYHLDLGYHAIGGGVLSNLNNVFLELNDHVDFLESYVGLINDDGYDFPFLSKLDKIKIFPKILRLLFASEKTLRKLDNVSITETIERYGKGKMKLILEIFSRSITTINNLDLISTGEMFRAQRNLYKGSKPVGYPKKGLKIIHKKFSDYITKNGGKIYINKPIEKIIIKNNKAIGVIVDDKKIHFDIIVSSILVQELFKIADENCFPEKYVSNLKSLKGTGSLCAYHSINDINDELIGKTFHFIERDIGVEGRDAVGMIDFMSASSDSNLAPSNKYLIQSYIICNSDEARDNKLLEKLRYALDNNLERLYPDFRSYLNWSIYPAIWHLDGVAKTIDNEKPDVTTPIDNFYIIGDCVKAKGIGFNCALNSARILVEIILKK